jgi:hypothetical protein
MIIKLRRMRRRMKLKVKRVNSKRSIGIEIGDRYVICLCENLGMLRVKYISQNWLYMHFRSIESFRVKRWGGK